MLFSAKNAVLGGCGLPVAVQPWEELHAEGLKSRLSLTSPEIQAELIFVVGLHATYGTWNKLSGFAAFLSLMKI